MALKDSQEKNSDHSRLSGALCEANDCDNQEEDPLDPPTHEEDTPVDPPTIPHNNRRKKAQ